jgi:nitrite reductase/ring-hydroxylating ferredoxin subunit/uncharacterized membrane protein
MSESESSAAGTPATGVAVDGAVTGEQHKESWMDRLGEALQNGIKVLVGSNRRPPRRLKTLLNGTWLRHPLHSVLTDVPVAAWLLTAAFDVIWLAWPVARVWAPRGAEVAVLGGLVGAIGAIVTGATDWSDTYGAERRVGLLHGTLNITAFILYTISASLRLTTSSGQSLIAAIVGFAGLVVVSTAAYFGGDLVYAKGTGVNHTAWEPVIEEFEPVAALADVPDRRLFPVVASGVKVILLREGERIYAIGATCTHAGGPLDAGTLEGGVVQCPWHGSRFRMRDGHVLTGPATVSEPRYDVRVRDGQVEIKRHA